MKRIAALLLATLMLAFSLTACADRTRTYRTETTTRDGTRLPRTTTEVERRDGFVYDNDGVIDDLERGNGNVRGAGTVINP